MALINLDAIAQTIKEDFEPASEENVLAGLREGCHQAMTGDTYPASTLRDAQVKN